MQQVQVSQTYKEDTKSTETQANNSSSSSVSVKTRVRSFINEKRRMPRDEKYLIVPDDVWHSRVWDYLRGALTDDHIGFKISTRQLHQLWIAEGFIHENSEATAECYLVELVDRGFIQAMRTTSVGRQNQNVLYSWYFAADIHLKG
ncbi:hypothetical protein CISIN_1g046923mg [Citrus sinensis]|uniref:Disease resistance protein winged helix domain-containing protein n=1 Tax=Citrus sinensis TaxID=2711 RepID=A0A067EG06_CITSI|nr:hypothetical protein CISIN_1g046923mg [Citrus sinensis]